MASLSESTIPSYRSIPSLLPKLPVRGSVPIDEYTTDQKAHGRYYEVSNRHIDIFPTENTGSGKHDVFVAVVDPYVEVVSHLDSVGARGQWGLYSPPEFSKVGSACRSHPHYKVLILGVYPLD